MKQMKRRNEIEMSIQKYYCGMNDLCDSVDEIEGIIKQHANEKVKESSEKLEGALKIINKQDFDNMAWNSVQGWVSSALKSLQ